MTRIIDRTHRPDVPVQLKLFKSTEEAKKQATRILIAHGHTTKLSNKSSNEVMSENREVQS